MNQYHIFKVKYLGPTNRLPTRVSIKSCWYNQKITVSYDYSDNGSYDLAVDYLKCNGYSIVGIGENTNGYFVVSETFKPLKEANL